MDWTFRPSHRRIAVLAIAALGIIGARHLGLWPWSEVATTEQEAARQHGLDDSLRHSTVPARSATTPRLPASAGSDPANTQPVRPRPGLQVTSPHPPSPTKPRFKVAKLFGDDCSFGVSGHCREWRELAGRCDEGKVDDCVRLGDLLIDDSPSQPLWGSILLRRACELGHDPACARGQQWNEWSKFGYRSHEVSADDQVPLGLADACASGHHVACGLLQMARAHRGQPLDSDVGLAACRAGFRDVCSMMLEKSQDPETAFAALTTGCDLPDAWMCLHLARYYSIDCADLAQGVQCPTPDPVLAMRYRRLACELAPELSPCRQADAR